MFFIGQEITLANLPPVPWKLVLVALRDIESRTNAEVLLRHWTDWLRATYPDIWPLRVKVTRVADLETIRIPQQIDNPPDLLYETAREKVLSEEYRLSLASLLPDNLFTQLQADIAKLTAPPTPWHEAIPRKYWALVRVTPHERFGEQAEFTTRIRDGYELEFVSRGGSGWMVRSDWDNWNHMRYHDQDYERAERHRAGYTARALSLLAGRTMEYANRVGAAWYGKVRHEQRRHDRMLQIAKNINIAWRTTFWSPSAMYLAGTICNLFPGWGTIVGAALIAGGTALSAYQKQVAAKRATQLRKDELEGLRIEYENGLLTDEEYQSAQNRIIVEEAEAYAAEHNGQLPPVEDPASATGTPATPAAASTDAPGSNLETLISEASTSGGPVMPTYPGPQASPGYFAVPNQAAIPPDVEQFYSNAPTLNPPVPAKVPVVLWIFGGLALVALVGGGIYLVKTWR